MEQAWAMTDAEFAEHRPALEALTRNAVRLLAIATLGAFTSYGVAVYLWWNGFKIAPIALATITFLCFRWLRRRALRLSLQRLPAGSEREVVAELLKRELASSDPDAVLRSLHQRLLTAPER